MRFHPAQTSGVQIFSTIFPNRSRAVLTRV